MPKLSPARQLEILGEHVIRARIHFDLWWFLEGEDSFSQVSDTLNEFSEFFLFDTNAHFASMIIRSAIIWDTTKGSISLPKTAKTILDTKCPAKRKQLDDCIIASGKQAEGIRYLRNNVIAHVTDKESRVGAFEKAGIIPNELPGMMTSWLDVINELRLVQSPSLNRNLLPDFRDLPLHHIQRLIHRLGGPDLRPQSFLDDILGS